MSSNRDIERAASRSKQFRERVLCIGWIQALASHVYTHARECKLRPGARAHSTAEPAPTDCVTYKSSKEAC
jgi:hypothetical protein